MVGKHWYGEKERNSSDNRKERITMKKREGIGIGKGEGGRKMERETKREKDEERSPDNPWSHLSAGC